MKLTNTTLNFAARRNVLVELVSADVIETDEDRLWIYEEADDCEPSVFYIVNADGTLTFSSSHLEQSTTEQLPPHITNEIELREVIDIITANRA